MLDAGDGESRLSTRRWREACGAARSSTFQLKPSLALARV
jgi:hypothetical protein